MTDIQRAEKNEDYFESQAAVLKWVETFYAGWRECIALTDELGEDLTFASVWKLLSYHGWRWVKAPTKVLECEGGYAYLPPETDSKSNWYAGKRHVSWFTSKDVTDMAHRKVGRKGERDMLHAEEDTLDDAEEYDKGTPDDIAQSTVRGIDDSNADGKRCRLINPVIHGHQRHNCR